MSQDEARRSDAATPTMAAVAAVVGAPEFVLPWLDRFYDGEDVELLLAVGRPGEGDDAPAGLASVEPQRLERGVRRAVLDRDERGAYAPASFADRLDICAMFGGWRDIPDDVRRRLADWATDDYAASVRDDLEALKSGARYDLREIDYTYLLLPEAEAVIAAEEHVYLWPCDCRAIVGGCDKPVDVCLRFDNDRGLGLEISNERAVEILRETDVAGLTHTDYLGRSAGDKHAICNCCTDCCFPHRAASLLDAESVWPRRRHLAVIDFEECTQCGTCAERCPFAAITMSADDEPLVGAATCRGCGLCSTGCPAETIAMQPLAAPA
ncbi:MAG: 4Fe-4S binding protein [Actinobacteria bacterium]|nr:4Fe-4S binding protein [Actinomycetota bacterium]